MIYITVGTYPNGFDELIIMLDQYAKKNEQLKFIAQISGGKYKPQHMSYVNFYANDIHLSHIRDASVVITHVGLASIAEVAKFYPKKLLVYPRKNFSLHDQIVSAKLLLKYYPFKLILSEDEMFKNLSENIKQSV